jgi:peptide/nickel transport system substrate-binding protein
LNDIERQDPQAICELRPRGVSSNLIVNSRAPPFDNPDLRRAMALTLDRKAFIDILSEGQASIGGAMLPPPEGLWGMPPDRLRSLPGYGPDVQKNRSEAREIMQRLGYGPDNLLAVKIAARNIPLYRDPAVMLIDQLKEIYITGELDIVETANWNPKVTRRDYMVGLVFRASDGRTHLRAPFHQRHRRSRPCRMRLRGHRATSPILASVAHRASPRPRIAVSNPRRTARQTDCG